MWHVAQLGNGITSVFVIEPGECRYVLGRVCRVCRSVQVSVQYV